MKIPVAGQDYELNLPKGHLSFSQIDLYLNCPQKYYRSVVLGEEEEYTEPLAEGQAMHTVMKETNLTRFKTKKHLPLDKAIKLHRRACKDEAKKLSGAGDPNEWMARGEQFLTKAWGKRGPVWRPCRMDDGKPGVEWDWNLELAGVKVKGISDLVEEGNCTDYKVASAARDYRKKPKYDPLKGLQANLNRIATQRNRFCFEVFEKMTGKIELLSAKVKELEPIERWVTFVVANVAQSISAGAFAPCDPTKNGLCDQRWCDFHSTCAGVLSC